MVPLVRTFQNFSQQYIPLIGAVLEFLGLIRPSNTTFEGSKYLTMSMFDFDFSFYPFLSMSRSSNSSLTFFFFLTFQSQFTTFFCQFQILNFSDQSNDSFDESTANLSYEMKLKNLSFFHINEAIYVNYCNVPLDSILISLIMYQKD